jgi:hypothetical protein
VSEKPQNVGYAQLSASGRTIKIYEGDRFIGLVSVSDIDKLVRNRGRLVVTIIKYGSGSPVWKSGLKNAELSKRNFDINLFEKRRNNG